MICPNCGKEAGESKFCPECGNTLTENVVIYSENNDSKVLDDTIKNTDKKPFDDNMNNSDKTDLKLKRIVMIILISVIVMIALIIILSSINEKNSTDDIDSNKTNEILSESNASKPDYSAFIIEDEKFSEEANAIDNKIKNISEKELTIYSREQLLEIRDHYNRSNEKVKNKVKLIDNLTEIEKEYDQLLERTKKGIESNFKSKYDNVEETTVFSHKEFPEYINTRSYVLPLMVNVGELYYLGLRWNYTGENWISFKNATIKTDNNKYKKEFNYFDIDHHIEIGSLNETYDQLIFSGRFEQNTDGESGKKGSEEILKILQEIADSKTAIIRLSGDNNYYDLTMTETDKRIIRETLLYYYCFAWKIM